VKADPTLAPRTTLVEDPQLLAELGPVADLIVVQTPRVVEAVRQVLAEVQLADFSHQERSEMAGPSSFEVAPPVPFDGPTLIITARQDQIVGYRAAWDLLDTYPRATFAVLDRAGHFVPIEQDVFCHALMREWLDRVEQSTPSNRPHVV
jgi:pimeloyl-ACP methyl ester carboxylesterase